MAVAAAGLTAALAPAQGGLPEGTTPPVIRRVFVPIDREQVWPAGDWQPVALAELERQLDAARAAVRARPRTFLERAEYSATLVGSELRDARLEWFVRKPDSAVSALPLGRFNLNVSRLVWSAAESGGRTLPALWGTDPRGTATLIVNRRHGRLSGDWSLTGRPLASSTEFELELPSAAISRLTLRIPAGLVLTSTGGELSEPAAALQPGWNEWRLNLGGQSACRLRVAPPADPKAARPLVLVRNNLNYFVRPEAVRLLAEFDLEILESRVRELRLHVDPEVQVTSVEYGDDGQVVWKATPSSAGQDVIVQLPDAISGEGHSLQVQGIAQVKQFAPWTLPRIRLNSSVEAAGRSTVRLASPSLAADVRTDGYRQIELTADADEGEILVFRQLRGDGTITIVPTDSKPDLSCRAVTLIQPDRHQWSMTSQWEWTAMAGSTFATSCLVSGLWDIIDVRAAAEEGSGELSGWEVQESEPGRRILHLYFLNALRPDRPQRVRISARRLPPDGGERAVVPPLVTLDASAVEQYVVASTSSEFRAVVEGAGGFELLTPGDLPPETRALDFLDSRLADPAMRSIVCRSTGPSASAGLRVEPAELRRDSTGAAPPAEPAPGAALPGAAPASSPAAPSPVSLELDARLTSLASGFDHYLARFRLTRPTADAVFNWTLPHPAELLGVEVDNRRVVPFIRGTTYSVAALAAASAGAGEPADGMAVAVEYRVPTGKLVGPNSRPFVLPECDRLVERFELALRVPQDVRLESPPDGIVLAGFDEGLPWYRRLACPLFRPAAESIFNPFRQSTWPALLRADGDARGERPAERVWRGSAAALPVGARLVVWNAGEVQWLAWALLLVSLLAGLLARLVQIPARRALAIIGPAGLCLATLVLPPVFAELAGSALTGVLLSLLFPRRFLAFTRPTAPRETADVPVGSTQSFVPIAGLLLSIGGMGFSLSARAQEPAAPAKPATVKNGPAVVDVLVPVGADGRPAGETPVAYVPAGLMGRLQRLVQAARLPDYLIAGSTFDGTVEATNRLRVSARFEIHVFASDAVVAVPLPLGMVNLGGADACLVDGQPHSVISGPEGRGLIVELPGAEPIPAAPPVPEEEAAGERPGDDADRPAADPADQLLPLRTCTVQLHLFPAVDAGRGDLFSSTVGIPPGCQTRATLSPTIPLAVMGITAAEAGPPPARPILPAAGKVHFRPGPTKQLVFFWSETPRSASSAADESKSVPAAAAEADVQAGVSCLADVSATLVQMRYHVAYRVQSGRVDSLAWHVPAGYVLESVQAPQLAGYRFEPGRDGGRRMLIEFSRPQTGDFSLAATFALAADRGEKQIPLPLLDPLREEEGQVRQIGLRFHQIAVRHPSDLRVTLAPPFPDLPPLKPRPVDEFLKEWNAAGARPQQAFDLEHAFALKLVVESPPAIPAVRGSSVARFHPGRLEFTYLAEVAQPAVPLFLYRLHVDPRLRIRSVSVLEDGAERRLRWSQMRETAIVFLNDRATRAQSVRVDATMPLSSSQEIDLPRTRFIDATPGPERITLYRHADVAIQLANPEDFPLSPAGETETDPTGDRLVARLDVLPEQARPRVRIEPVLPRISARRATVLELRDGAWRSTTIVAFELASGRVTEFAIDVPEAVAATIEPRSVPASRVSTEPPVGGRVTLTFHPDEPVQTRFTAVLSGAVEMSQLAWPPPPVLPGAAATAAFLVFPHGAFEPPAGAETVAVPEWLSEVVPATIGSTWDCFRLSAESPLPQLRPAREVSSKTFAGSAQVELWLGPDGALAGRLGFHLAGNLPPLVELDWPPSARPTALFAGGAFQPLPVPADGLCSIPVPAGTTDRLVWLAWVDARRKLPLLSGPLSASLPWPRQIPVENCRLIVHPPPRYHGQAAASLAPAAPETQAPLVPAVFAANEKEIEPRSDDLSLAVLPVPGPGAPFDVGKSIKIVNARPGAFGVALVVALIVALVCWKFFPLWSWLVRNDTLCWLVLAAFWWLFLAPSWLGPVLAVWASFKALRSRTIPAHDFASASTAHAPPPLGGAGF
ncbi:MAG: hypothetical protein ACM3U2_15500 [Deltaproteobacteria bacterium]